jgi:hypothetical protein
VLHELAAAGFEMEYRLNAEIRHTVLNEIGILEGQLVEAQNRNTKYLADMRGGVHQEVSQLRDHILQELTSMSKANFVLRQNMEKLIEDMANPASPPANGRRSSQTLQNETTSLTSSPRPPKSQVVSESGKKVVQHDIEGFHNEIHELHKAHTRLQTFYRLKFQTLHQTFEKKIQAFTTTLSSNNDLWERASEIKEREIIAEDELNRAQRRLTDAADVLERSSAEAAREAETAAKLIAWKEHAFEWLNTLQREEKKYQREGSDIDVEKLGYYISKLEAEIKTLDSGNRCSQRVTQEREKAMSQIKTMRRSLKLERELESKASAKTALIKREMECGEQADQESLVGLLCDEFKTLSQQCVDVEAKNAFLRAKVNPCANHRASMLTAATREAESREFEESMCFTIGSMKLPQALGNRKQIDKVHGGGRASTSVNVAVPSLSARRREQPSPGPSSARASSAGQWGENPHHQEAPGERSNIIHSIRNDMGMSGDQVRAQRAASGRLSAVLGGQAGVLSQANSVKAPSSAREAIPIKRENKRRTLVTSAESSADASPSSDFSARAARRATCAN